MNEPIKTIEQAREIINKLQHRADSTRHELDVARGRIYDFIYKGKDEPTEKDLKAQIIYLESELKKVISTRDEYKELYKNLLAKVKSNLGIK